MYGSKAFRRRQVARHEVHMPTAWNAGKQVTAESTEYEKRIHEHVQSISS